MRRWLGLLIALVTHAGGVQAAADIEPKGRAVQRTPPINVHYVQTGVAIAAELVPFAGAVCPADAEAPCILGSGSGLTIRAGHRSRRPWYLGGALELSRHDSSNLLRLAILEQVRAEARRYFEFGRRFVPYGVAGVGALAYGNEFGVETGGFSLSAGGGGEFQLNRSAVVGGALAYRAFFIRRWRDSAGEERADGTLGFGLAHVICLEFTLEMRQQLSRW